MARPKDQETREIREFVAEGEPMTREQLAGWLLQWFTGGDLRGYAEKAMKMHEEAITNGKG